MTTRRLIAGVFVGCFSGMLIASASETPQPLRARIVQLEEQVRQLQRGAQICAAQLAIAVQPQQDREAQERLDQAAKDMGCKNGADWTANPPACKG